MIQALERYFEFKRLNTSWKTEIVAGLTTFITMAYIVFVNPAILRDAGMPLPAVFGATSVSAALGTLLMGAFARYPIALAPGMDSTPTLPYVLLHVLRGRARELPWSAYPLALLLIARFVYIGSRL